METINSSLSTKKRIDYIDAIKGIVIFGVVWVHTSHPDWLTPILVNSIFFFLSGIFFKRKPINTFILDKTKSLLIPFVFFYLISYPFRIIVHAWNFRTLETFNWMCIFDVFTFSAKTDYMFVNVPIWFLICLFVIQILYYFISYLNKWFIGIIALLCILFKDIFLSFPSFFMINVALYYTSFFALGNLFGRPLIEKLKQHNFQKSSVVLSVPLFATFFLAIPTQSKVLYDILLHFRLFAVFFVLMSIGSLLNEKKSLILLRFYGENSLTILGIHIMPLIVVMGITNAIFGYSTPFMGFIQSVIVVAIMHVVIQFCNKYIPMLVGKKVHASA